MRAWPFALVLLLVVVGLGGGFRGPASEAASDRVVYLDGLESGWENWSWSVTTLDLCATVVVQQGSCAALVDLAAWGGLSFRHADFSTASLEALTFYIHGGSSGGQQFEVYLHGAGGGGGSELPPISLNNPAYIEGGTISAGVWKLVTIPLADLSGSNRLISRVTIQAVGEQPLFYVDDMRLTGSTTPPIPFSISVDAADVRGPITSRMFGTNAAMWSSNLDQNSDVIAKLAPAGLTVMRFPGGSTSDTYHWQEYEPGHSGNQWTTNSSEFIQFAQAVGAEPMITVNFGSGSAQEAAAWVHYMNVEHDWNVKYWEVGNEIYGDWETSWTHDAAQYMLGDATHDGFNEFCAAMKAVDPTIQVGVVGTLDETEYNGWGPTVLELASDCLDFYVIHRYPLAPGNSDYAALLADPPTAWPVVGDTVRGMIATHAPGVELAVTEYNSYYTLPEVLAMQTVNMLFLADSLGQIIEQEALYANQWDILNGSTDNNSRYGLLLEGMGNYRQPSYYVYPLWSRAGDQRLAPPVTNRNPATELTAYASRHSDTGAVTLLLVNKSEAMTGTITLDNLQAPLRLEAYVGQGSDLSDSSVAYNGSESPPIDLGTVPPLVSFVSSTTFSYTLPAYSVTSLTLFGEIPTGSPTATPTEGPSPTATATPTEGPSPTATVSPTKGPSPTATATLPTVPNQSLYLPLIRR